MTAELTLRLCDLSSLSPGTFVKSDRDTPASETGMQEVLTKCLEPERREGFVSCNFLPGVQVVGSTALKDWGRECEQPLHRDQDRRPASPRSRRLLLETRSSPSGIFVVTVHRHEKAIGLQAQLAPDSQTLAAGRWQC